MAGHRLAKDSISTLRIFASPFREISSCRWAVTAKGQSAVVRDGLLSDLPRGLSSVQLILPATDVVFLRTRLPKDIRRRNRYVLAFAVEDQTLTDPAANQVFWLGKADDGDVLAIAAEIVSTFGAMPWKRSGFADIRYFARRSHCRSARTPGPSHGTAKRDLYEPAHWKVQQRIAAARHPPQTLRLLLDDAKRSGRMPKAVTIHPTGSALSRMWMCGNGTSALKYASPNPVPGRRHEKVPMSCLGKSSVAGSTCLPIFHC